MKDIKIERLKKSEGKEVLIFLKNGFRYKGKITNCDDKYVEILDWKTNCYKLIEITNIREAEINAD